jgi:hypothetical protein
MLTDIHHSLEKSSRESNLDCNPFCELDRRIFDTVAHTAIYLKLLDMNVGGLFHNLIKDMYKISAVCVQKVGNL